MNTIVEDKIKEPSKFRVMYWGFINKISPIWYRFFGHKHHIIKTKLEPSAWIDTDYRMLYGVMALVEWFVENDMDKITEEDYHKELERMNKEDPDGLKNMFIDHWKEQYKTNQEILKIYKWWKDYPNREKEIDIALSRWYENDGKYIFDNENKSDPKYRQELDELRDKLDREEQEMLKKAVELRRNMWS